LAVANCQEKQLTWRLEHTAKNEISWLPAAKNIEFPWLSILGAYCLAVDRQELFSWRF